MQAFTLFSGRKAALLGFFSSLALGCVISVGGGDTAGPSQCGSLLAHNDANCNCDDGYERCNPDDASDTDCCIKEGKGGECEPNSSLNESTNQCFCNTGYTWCSDDPADLTCCVDPGQSSQGTGTGTDGETSDLPTTGGTTGGPVECDAAVLPPETCDEAAAPFFCTHPDSCSPEGSKYYVCQGGVYVESTSAGDDDCKLNGYDFSYGCLDTGSQIDFVCGYGPGTACQTGEANTCNETQLLFCEYGKLGGQDCFTVCTVDGIDGVVYDYGYCGEQAGDINCICCDEGEDDCPVGGETSTGGDTTGGSSSSGGSSSG